MKLAIEDSTRSKFYEVLKSLGICWLTLAIICQMNFKTTDNKGLWWGLFAFHSMNSIAILLNSRKLDLDSVVSIALGSICIYALRQVPVKKLDARKVD